MAERSGFFDAHLVNGEYDRVYLAEHFAKYFASFIANGVFGGKSNELMVQQDTPAGMSVKVLSGQAWIDGYWYENDNELSLAIDVADGVLNRVDSIVLRWNNVERVIRVAVKKGTPATNASAPVLQRDADYYELKLADIQIKAGATRITQIDITDTRLREDVCGFVVGVVQQLDTNAFGVQLAEYVENFIAEYDELKTETEEEITAWKTQITNAYNSWFTSFVSSSISKVDKVVSDGTERINTLISEKQTEIDALISENEEKFNQSMAELDEIKADNDLTALYQRVSNAETNIGALSDLFVESNVNKGCFYRVASTGENEWINPPNEVGVSYRTTERWNAQPVYVRNYFIASLPNKTVMGIDVDINWNKILSIDGFAYSEDDSYFYPFPIILNGLSPVAAITRAEGDGGTGSTIVIQTNDDLTHLRGYIRVKYTKE